MRPKVFKQLRAELMSFLFILLMENLSLWSDLFRFLSSFDNRNNSCFCRSISDSEKTNDLLIEVFLRCQVNCL